MIIFIENTFSNIFFVIVILTICVIWVTLSMHKEAVEKETNETRTESDHDMNIERLLEKYHEVLDRNAKLMEESRRLRFENSYLSNQLHGSGLMNDSEFQQNLKDLIILSHPDKHGGQERAKRVTQWLLQLRQKN